MAKCELVLALGKPTLFLIHVPLFGAPGLMIKVGAARLHISGIKGKRFIWTGGTMLFFGPPAIDLRAGE